MDVGSVVSVSEVVEDDTCLCVEMRERDMIEKVMKEMEEDVDICMCSWRR